MKDHLTLSFKTKNGKTYDTGARNRSEIEPTVEWIGKNWGISIKMSTSSFVSPASPSSVSTVRKVRVTERFCSQCGRSSDGMLLFCPYCGTNFATVTKHQPSVENAWQAPADPPNPYVRSAPEPPQPRPVYPPQYPSHSSAQMTRPDGKNPRLAFILALMPGFLGSMGIGHLYMGKCLKGLVLLFLGGFQAMLSMVSILMLFEPSEFEFEVRVFTVAFLSAPYLGLQLWPAFDAPKPDNSMPLNPY